MKNITNTYSGLGSNELAISLRDLRSKVIEAESALKDAQSKKLSSIEIKYTYKVIQNTNPDSIQIEREISNINEFKTFEEEFGWHPLQFYKLKEISPKLCYVDGYVIQFGSYDFKIKEFEFKFDKDKFEKIKSNLASNDEISELFK